MTDSFSNSVSIIIPTLNEEENILPLVAEIAACGVSFREILFVDDHSTDATCDKIRALAGTHPIRLVEQNGEGPGLATAIMSGARVARGEILQRFGGAAVCRHRRPCGRQPLCQGWVDAGLAGMAAGRVTSGGGACASAHWPSRLDVWLLCHWSFPLVGTRAANQRFQNCFRDDVARARNAART